MNIRTHSFDIFFVPHSSKWTVIVRDKGIRLNAPFLIECGNTVQEACDKIMQYCDVASRMDNLADAINAYENKHRRDAG